MNIENTDTKPSRMVLRLLILWLLASAICMGVGMVQCSDNGYYILARYSFWNHARHILATVDCESGKGIVAALKMAYCVLDCGYLVRVSCRATRSFSFYHQPSGKRCYLLVVEKLIYTIL